MVAACGNDLKLLAEVESLLAEHEFDPSFLDEPFFDELSPTDRSTPAPPVTIGHYRVVRELGRGGMGEVYLAYREEVDFQREVAVKVIRRGLDTEEFLRRFHNERRILARLSHQNIAAFLDGGGSCPVGS